MYDVGTPKNRLIETVLLSTQNKCENGYVRKYLQFYAQKLCLSKPVSTKKTFCFKSLHLFYFVVTTTRDVQNIKPVPKCTGGIFVHLP